MKTRILLIAFLLSPLYFYGWGTEGHHLVAEIAKQKLNPGVEAKVQQFLGTTTFEQAATWMDDMRSDHAFDFMKPWHYLNIEKDSTYKKAKEGDIASELETVIGELKNYHLMKPEEVAKDLKILFHLFGDLGQPLHVGYGKDKGGNDIKLTINNNAKPSNLHHVWDTDIIDSTKINTASCLKAANKFSKKKLAVITKIDVMAWAMDSRAFLPAVYKVTDKKITTVYLQKNKLLVEQQIAKSGLRLAAILNEVFKN